VALILSVVMLFYASRLQFYNVENIYKYLVEIGLALCFVFSAILTVVLAARQYPSETQNRTLQVLMSKPIPRLYFVLGKFLGSLAAGTLCFMVFYAVFLFFVAPKFHGPWIPIATQTFYLFFLNLMVLTAMTSGLSYSLTVSANVAITLIVFALINTYGMALKTSSAGLFWLSRWLANGCYYLLPHFEFFDARQRFIHGWEPVSVNLVVFLTGYAILYSGFFLMIGTLLFRRKSL
jgi:Cu-processing system permease protein